MLLQILLVHIFVTVSFFFQLFPKNHTPHMTPNDSLRAQANGILRTVLELEINQRGRQLP